MHTLSPSTLAYAALGPLVGWRIYLKFRRSIGPQRLSKYRAPIVLALYLALTASVLTPLLWPAQPMLLLLLALSLVAGAALAVVALSKTTFRASKKGLFYTPFKPLSLGVATLFLARVAFMAFEMCLTDADSAGITDLTQSPLTLEAFGLFAGYYGCYTAGLARWRAGVLKAKRDRLAQVR